MDVDVKLVMFKENGQRRDFPILSEVTVIGRREDCDLRIPLPEISRRHAQLVVQGRSVILRDLGSTNGTYVNNQRITELQLNPGDHLVIGPVVFTIQIAGEPEVIRPVRTKLERRVPAGAEAAPASPKPTTPPAAEDELFSAGAGDSDPISALEALAASGDETALEPFISDEEDDKPTQKG